MPNRPPHKSPNYVTRLTWNTFDWRKPSGPGKKEKGTYVARSGFGHEEWLNRSEWVFGGWRYAFLQGVNRQRKRLVGKTLNIRLYTINPMKERLYVGTLKSAEVIHDDTAKRALTFFKKNGLIKQMNDEVGAAGGKSPAFSVHSGSVIANIRFRPESLKMYQEPIPALPSDRILRFSRYAMIRADSNLLKQWAKRTRRAPWQEPPLTGSVIYKRASRRECRRQNVPFFFKQWGGVRKSKNGRILDGRTYDEMPTTFGANGSVRGQHEIAELQRLVAQD